ncbi:suppressor of fused homolog [Petromyzon marinus]|uniref:suppressor of fused homolog n=1 Tax=Petromyzon marinus TaxID=7757 RepID=UPI003F6E5546
MEGAPPTPATPATPSAPLGLRAIYQECRRAYPDQPNPLQVTAIIKYWLGGPDPLDYVSMYRSAGDRARGVPEHWHYVTMGLSDLYGDGRAHERGAPEELSGFGFELTFRVRREVGESAPPTWPAELLQGLARYVFQSENTLCAGDHVSWHVPLDGSESRLQHMLVAPEPQLQPLRSPLGTLSFLQVVGVCAEEMRAAQQWNGLGVLELLSSVPGAGGPWLVTDMRRGESVFELEPRSAERVERGVEAEGSNLSGVSARCAWEEEGGGAGVAGGGHNLHLHHHPDYNHQGHHHPDYNHHGHHRHHDEDEDDDSIILPGGGGDTCGVGGAGGCGEERFACPGPPGPPGPHGPHGPHGPPASPGLVPHELVRARRVGAVCLQLNMEAALLVPLALRGRILHGRHFTFKSVSGLVALTLVSSAVHGALVRPSCPHAAHGPWLQILIPDEFARRMLGDMSDLVSEPHKLKLPREFSWPDRRLRLLVLPDADIDSISTPH